MSGEAIALHKGTSGSAVPDLSQLTPEAWDTRQLHFARQISNTPSCVVQGNQKRTSLIPPKRQGETTVPSTSPKAHLAVRCLFLFKVSCFFVWKVAPPPPPRRPGLATCAQGQPCSLLYVSECLWKLRPFCARKNQNKSPMARGVARGDALQLLGLSRGASEREVRAPATPWAGGWGCLKGHYT